METKRTSEQNLNELVFENRNKAYGAYALRSSYDDHIIKALFVSFVLAAAIALLAFLTSSKIPEAIPNLAEQLKLDDNLYVQRTIEIEKPKVETKTIEKLTKPPVDVPKSDNLSFQASDNKEDVVEHTNEEASINKDGKPDGNDDLPSTTEEPAENVGTTVNEDEVRVASDEMPEFNGNIFQFIRNNIEYPEVAKAMGTSGTVVLQFVVEKDGSIDEIKILKSVPDGCTAEAIRVVKAMPKWKPGKNKGRPVRVLFNLPIKFTLK